MQIFLTGNSFRLRKCALRCPNYTLQDMIMYGRKAETSSEHASGIEERFIQEVRVNAVDRSQHTCYNCVFAYPRQAQPCPVKMQDAKFSSKKGRFSTVCRQKSSQYSIQSKTKERHPRTIANISGIWNMPKPSIRCPLQYTTTTTALMTNICTKSFVHKVSKHTRGTEIQTLFVKTGLRFESSCKQIPKHLNEMAILIAQSSKKYRQYIFWRILDL